MRFLLSLSLLFIIAIVSSQSVIPKVQHNELLKGSFKIEKNIILYTNAEYMQMKYLQNQLYKTAGVKALLYKNKPFKNYIILNKTQEGDSVAYKVDIDSLGIIISSAGDVGLLYGIQTVVQLISTSQNNDVEYQHISDYPTFKWRGMHLDCSRHFFSVEEVKRYLDLMAMYKMNVFHWHLTDDQGWRIEIKKYPELTKISAYRNGSMVGRYSDHIIDTIRYGGYYSQNDIKEIVNYAANIHITIVPEVEMPGHSMALLASHPELSCKGGSFQVAKQWGVYNDVLCAGNESVFDFMENVLDEVIELFPGDYIHIGGDECPKVRWDSCNLCQKRIEDEGLKDSHELQSYFINRIDAYVNSKGKKIIGWDEILEGNLSPRAAVMSWRGEKGGVEAANSGHFVVMTPGKPCYFDHYQVKDITDEPIAIGGYNPLSAVYSYNIIPNGLDSNNTNYIMGAQANVWTEYMPTFSQVEYMMMPRMMAISEVLWRYPAKRDYQDFISRLKAQKDLLDRLKINYCSYEFNR
jgi:hexosaminidase